MQLPYIETLIKDNWKAASLEARIDALQQLENSLANQEGKVNCNIASNDQLDPSIYGQFNSSDGKGSGSIDINSALLSKDTPYDAVEILTHESRHAYQEYICSDSELMKNEPNAQDWKINHADGGYLYPNVEKPQNKAELAQSVTDYSLYRYQPIEADANSVARQQTDQLYEETFHDEQEYPAYKQSQENRIAQDEMYAKYSLGENYQEIAREEMINQYDAYTNSQEKNQHETSMMQDQTQVQGVDEKTSQNESQAQPFDENLAQNQSQGQQNLKQTERQEQSEIMPDGLSKSVESKENLSYSIENESLSPDDSLNNTVKDTETISSKQDNSLGNSGESSSETDEDDEYRYGYGM